MKDEVVDDSPFLLGVKGRLNVKEISSKSSYMDSGFYIIKNDLFKAIIRCGPLSMKGQGGHSHNDQLSFILSIAGLPVFIDPGTITYTGNAELRNLSRRTSSHNTVQIGDEEQNLIGNDLFALKERTFSKCIVHSDSHFEGEHQGFFDRFGCVHKRIIDIKDSEFSVSDFI
ncbi:heparinase II/III-family protein, partial [Pseudoalteromonas sp. Isolate6]|uniref:heparinase II/III family protein n=1 Tax=Pseudoalteromonas sp. Isolate6 TaxID=2908527 RepID=UPI001EFE3603